MGKINVKTAENYKAIKKEVLTSFELSEILGFASFEEFFSMIDQQNGYEEEWQVWEAAGVREVYLRIFKELRGEEAVSAESLKISLIDLICKIEMNRIALDEDMSDTWVNVLENWEEVQILMVQYLNSGNK